MTGALRRYLILIGILSLGLSGCLRSAGGDVGAPEGQAALNSPTPEPTAIPTLEPIIVTEEVIITTTPDPASQELFPDQESDVTPSELGALDLPAQDEGIPDDTAQQEQAQINPNLQTATAIIENATLQVIYQTQTAEAPVEPIATNTPEPVTQPTTAPGGPVFGGADCIHQVVTGENLFRLSLRYGVSIQDIAQASGIANPNLISVGQRLVIPGCGTTGQVPPPTTVADGSGGFGTGGPTTGTGGGTTYVVQQYDTLFEISMRYGVPIQSIAAANGISNINLIFIGDQLVIPSA
jgi:LysM repeat protein